jgi:hypothetical protein
VRTGLKSHWPCTTAVDTAPLFTPDAWGELLRASRAVASRLARRWPRGSRRVQVSPTSSPGRHCHSHATLYGSLVILCTKYRVMFRMTLRSSASLAVVEGLDVAALADRLHLGLDPILSSTYCVIPQARTVNGSVERRAAAPRSQHRPHLHPEARVHHVGRDAWPRTLLKSV